MDFVHRNQRYSDVCLFSVYCSFKGLQRGQNFKNINLHCSNYSALLPTTPIIFLRCRPRAEKWLALLSTKPIIFLRCGLQCGKVLLFQFMCFSALLPTTPIIFLRCRPEPRKLIGVVVYTAEKLSALSTTTRKNVWFRISPQIRISWGEKSRGTVPFNVSDIRHLKSTSVMPISENNMSDWNSHSDIERSRYRHQSPFRYPI